MSSKDELQSGGASISSADVHEALQCLYDGVALGNVALAVRLPALQQLATAPDRALALRTLLLDGIELLQPDRPTSFRSAATRSYDVMTMRFVEGLTMARIADELFISDRQAYRDLEHAEAQLAELLGSPDWAAQRLQPVGARGTQDIIGEELQNVVPQRSPVDVGGVLDSTLRTVRPLADALGISLSCSLPPAPPPAVGDAALLRATLVEMLSVALRNTRGSQVLVDVQPARERVTITLQFARSPEGDLQTAFAHLEGLGRAQGLPVTLGSSAEAGASVSIDLPCLPPRLVLVLDDNQGTIELFSRYLLGNHDWQLLAVTDPSDGLQAAIDRQPAVIILDVLMPKQDGWQVLQTLRNQPQTAHIPILVCSVFDEMDLAKALGASAYLKKPVTRNQFLASLEAAHSQGGSPGSRQRGQP